MSNDEGMMKSESRSVRLASSFNHSSLFRHSSFGLRHSLRIRRPQFGDNHEPESDRDEKEGEELAASETHDQTRIGLAKIFHDDPEDGLENKKQTGQHPIRLSHSCAHEPENRQENNPLEESFVELRWIA